MNDAQPCPRCDTPLPDTAYVCHRCADVLAVALRNAAANYDELETAVARQTAIAGSGGTGTPTPAAQRGPWCFRLECHHQSCLAIRKSRVRALSEDPIPSETNHVSFSAMEDAWIVTNTASTWARLIEDESGRPIPPPAYREPVKGEPRRVLAPLRKPLHVVASPSHDLCDYSWLPLDTCACGHSHPEKESAL